ncbi:MAG: ABC transporter permease, partial [Solirubrobacteraceae bacterium]
LGVAVFAAVTARWIAPDPSAVDLSATLAGPSPAHWLGADQQGRDVYARLVHGAQPSLLIPLVVVSISTVAGALLGLAAGWRRGLVDTLISRALDLTLALPGVLLALVIAARTGPGVVGPAVAIAIWLTPAMGRVVRTATVGELTRPYVAAYRLHGWRAPRIALTGVLPNLAGLILARAAIDIGRAIIALGSLSFLGVGVVPPAADWGAMVNDGRDALLQGVLLPTVAPSLALLAALVAVGVLGDRLGAHLEGRAGSS